MVRQRQYEHSLLIIYSVISSYSNRGKLVFIAGNYDKETIIRALEIEISILLAQQAESDVCYVCTNKHGNAYCGGSATIFGKYEVPNLSEKVESVYAIVLDDVRDGKFVIAKKVKIHQVSGVSITMTL